MKKSSLMIALAVVVLLAVGFVAQVETKKYKCLIQLTNYKGEGAYIVASLINPEGKYEQTLQVIGDDPEWYSELTQWWKFYGKRKTIGAGERTVKVINLADDKFNKGYKIRFETAVEDANYYAQDAEIELTTANLNTKVEGKGYIRYVRLAQ